MKDNTKKILRRILIILCLFVSIVSGYKLVNEFYGSHKTISQNDNLAKEVVKKNNNSNQIKDIDIDFNKLDAINKDTIGWINVPNTSISYPMVQKPNDNNYYLHRAFDGKSIIYGSIFIDGKNDPEFNDNVTFIFGHNIDTSVTFGKELYFTTLDEFQNKEYLDSHKNIQIFTKGGKKIDYNVIGLSLEKATTPLYKTKFNSTQEYIDYLKIIEKKFNIEPNTITKDNKLIVLCTCSTPTANAPYRRLLFAYK